MERDYSTPDSLREEYESDLRWERTRRHHRFFTAALILLVAGLVGGAWYVYPILKRHDATLSQVPFTLTDVQKRVFSLGEQAQATDANWIDVGGESTRPGSRAVTESEEIARVVPVIEGLRRRLGDRVRLSIDTYKSATARAAAAAGATVINDVSGGRLDPGLFDTAAAVEADIVIGHLRGMPATMMDAIHFDDVVAEVQTELGEAVKAARAAGCRSIWADPGIGFGKRLAHNAALLRDLPRLASGLGVPLMVGVSRKAFIGELTGKPSGARVFGTAAAVTAAVLGGAAAVRVHDVAAMRDVVAVAQALIRV